MGLQEEVGSITSQVKVVIEGECTSSQEVSETSEKFNLQKEIFSRWTGIDDSVYEQLENIVDLWKTLIKELGIIAELASFGASQKLLNLIRIAELEGVTYEDISDDLNALVEYGNLFEDLNEEQRQHVAQKEIQEEFGHFWRIMGIEAMRPQRIKRIVGEMNEVMETAGNLDRELGVIIERRISRNFQEPYIPIKKESEPESNVRILSPHTVSTQRRNYPHVSACVSLPEASNQDITALGKSVLVLFNKLLTKYPLEKAVALLDFLISKNDSSFPISFSAVQQFAKNVKQYVKCVVIGNQSVVHTRRNQDFSHSLMNTLSGEGADVAIGTESPVRYFMQTWEVKSPDQIFLLNQDYTEAVRSLTPEELSEILNKRGATGKILPTNNLQKYLRQPLAGVVSVKCQPREEVPIPEFNSEGILAQLSPVIESIKTSGKTTKIHIEAAHIHADRPISKAIEDGAKIGSVIAKELGSIDTLMVSSSPMVDDDHVVNNLDYEAFEEMLNREGYEADEVIFESSPLIYEISLDILKLLLAEFPEKVTVIGNNLYLESEGDMRIELVQDMEKEFITGCVLFDAALCLYKLYPEICAKIYRQRMLQKNPASPLAYSGIHQLMLQVYKNNPRPEVRTKEIKGLLPKSKPTLEELEEKKEERPYLKALGEQFAASKSSKEHMIMNVVEETYSSQQKKLAALTDMVGLVKSHDIVTVMFNQESGAISFVR